MINKKKIVSKPVNAIDIAVDLIDENIDNEAIFNMDGIEELAEGIRNEGFKGAITVYKKSDGRYEVSSGHRRLRAAKILNLKAIPCVVYDMPDDIERGIALLSSNIRNRTMKPMDWARAIKYYHELKNKAQKGSRLSIMSPEQFFNFSRQSIFRYMSLNKLNAKLQELANNPDFAYSSFARAANQLNEDEQNELYRRIIAAEGEKRNQIKDASGDFGDEPGGLSRSQVDRIVNDIVNERKRTQKKDEREESVKLGADRNELELSPLVDAFDEDSLNSLEYIEEDDASEPSLNELPAFEPLYGKNEDVSLMQNQRKVEEFDTYAGEIQKLTLGDLEFGNKDKIKRYIKIFEQAIEILQKML